MPPRNGKTEEKLSLAKRSTHRVYDGLDDGGRRGAVGDGRAGPRILPIMPERTNFLYVRHS
jgi:hypothetical protein